MIDTALRQLLIASAGVALVLAPMLLLRLVARRDAVLRYRLMQLSLGVVALALLLQGFAPAWIARWSASPTLDANESAASEWVVWLRDRTSQAMGPNSLLAREPAIGPARLVEGVQSAVLPARVYTVGAWASRLTPVLLAAYVIGLAASAVVLLLRLWRTRRLLRRCRLVDDPHILEVSQKAQLRVGFRRQVRLLESEEIGAPVCHGWWGGVVIIPTDRAATDASLTCALCHELVHLRRLDPAAAFVQRLFVMAFWFHPLVRVFEALLSRDRELSCDALVVRCLNNPRTYAHALLDYCRARPAFAALAGFDSKVTIKRRLEMIACARTGTSVRGMIVVTAGLALTAAMALGAHVALAAALAAPEPAVEETAKPDTARIDVRVQNVPRSNRQQAIIEAPPIERKAAATLLALAMMRGGAKASGTIVEQETLLSTPLFYELVERSSTVERRATARLELSSLTLNLPEGSSLRAYLEGRRVETAVADGATDITIHAGEVRIIDAAGVTRVVIRPKVANAPLKLSAAKAGNEVSISVTVPSRAAHEARLDVELDMTPAPATEADKEGATEIRYAIQKPGFGDKESQVRVKMQWVIDVGALNEDAAERETEEPETGAPSKNQVR